jgi:hypothetical protein
MFNKTIRIGLAVFVLGFAIASTAHSAQTRDNKTTLTFSQPVEIPGQVLPAGTYVFRLADSLSDRHIVQVFDADGSRVIATILAIANYRLTATDKTVITFTEVPRGSPEAIRAWFYPGNTFGQEFVYPKQRAVELAVASRAVVPAVTGDVVPAVPGDVAAIDALKTAPIVAVTPEQREVPVEVAIQTTPPATASSSVQQTRSVQQTGLEARQLPNTAGVLPLIVLLGFASIAAAFGLMAFRKPAYSSVR